MSFNVLDKGKIYKKTRFFFKWKNTEEVFHKSSIRIALLKNFAKFTRKDLCRSFFLVNCKRVDCNIIKKMYSGKDFFSVNFAKFFRTDFLLNIQALLLSGIVTRDDPAFLRILQETYLKKNLVAIFCVARLM